MLKFPSTGSEQTVAFRWRKRNSRESSEARAGLIFLPTPVAFELTDGATYTSVELGATLGGVGAGLTGDAFAGSGVKLGGALTRALAVVGGDLLDAKGVTKEHQGFVLKKIASPFSNTTFSGHTIRTYKFSFLMAPSNLAEANSIKEITNVFRRNLYGSADGGIFLDYPPIWKIEFLTTKTALSSDLKLNGFYPRLWPAYMTGFSSNSNPNAYGFYADGSPVEITIDLSFQETRALTQEDIISLEAPTPSGEGLAPSTGLPLSGMPGDGVMAGRPNKDDRWKSASDGGFR